MRELFSRLLTPLGYFPRFPKARKTHPHTLCRLILLGDPIAHGCMLRSVDSFPCFRSEALAFGARAFFCCFREFGI